MLYLFLFIYLLLGIHSVYYFVKCYTTVEDVTTKELPMLIVCLLIPIATHIATYITFDTGDGITIFPKKNE